MTATPQPPADAVPILIMGLICGPVPKCPNPDPSFFATTTVPTPA
jgi:hypothetical protein